MTPFKLHPEISCPLCRCGIGELVLNEKKQVQHEILTCFLEPLHLTDCSNQQFVKQNTNENINGVLEWNEETKRKLIEIEQQNKTDPDYSNQNCTWDEFRLVFDHISHITKLSFISENYDIKPIDYRELKELFESGLTIKEIILFFVVKKPCNIHKLARTLTVELTCWVEAESIEEAIKEAEKLPIPFDKPMLGGAENRWVRYANRDEYGPINYLISFKKPND